jgi:GGDEF domain-containing protein
MVCIPTAVDKTPSPLGQLLSEHFRTMDVVGRIGGEEFAALILDFGPDQALLCAQEPCDTARERTPRPTSSSPSPTRGSTPPRPPTATASAARSRSPAHGKGLRDLRI